MRTRWREVDTIGHPAYLRSMIDEIGWFDETLERNSDYEFNWRVRAAGHLLVFEPAIVTVYRPRTTIARLGRQFWWYGRWKERVVRRHPQSLRPRHLVPPAAVLGALLSPILLSSRWGRRVLAVTGVSYAALVAVATAQTKPRGSGRRSGRGRDRVPGDARRVGCGISRFRCPGLVVVRWPRSPMTRGRCATLVRRVAVSVMGRRTPVDLEWST